MSLASALSAGRTAAEARMTSRCTVRRKTAATTTVGGFKVPVWEDVHTDLPVRISGRGGGAAPSRRLDSGGLNVEVPVRTASFPHGTTDLRDGDLIDVTSGDTAGLVFRIVEIDAQDQATARRVPVVGAPRPGEWA